MLTFISLLFIINIFTGIPASTDIGSYDIVIQNGRILDGTGNPWYYADIGIKGNRIKTMGDLSDASAHRIIDADGLYIAPGFIDPHSHASQGLSSSELSFARPQLAQGITLVVVNPDGGGPVDLEAQKLELENHEIGVNVAQLIPHGSIRSSVVGSANREATPEELDQMRTLVRIGMEYGAFGLSSGIFYVPGTFAPTEEYIELCHVVAEYGGVHQSHIRDESDYSIGVVASVNEIIEITRETQVIGIITHIKALGTGVWGKSAEVIENIEKAREEGLPVFTDQYPYEASSTSLVAALVPTWAREGGIDALRERLADSETRKDIIKGILENLDRRGGADRIQYRLFRPDPSIEGRTLQDVADETNTAPEQVVVAQIELGNPSIVSFNMHEDDIHNFMRQSWNMTASDGGLTPIREGVPHPRNYGTFPRKIRKYVLEDEILSLEQAIRSMTSLTASVFGMHNRGLIRPGMIADVVIFDLKHITDRATYQDPHQYSEGMEYVIVNGGIALDQGAFTFRKFGEVVRSK